MQPFVVKRIFIDHVTDHRVHLNNFKGLKFDRVYSVITVELGMEQTVTYHFDIQQLQPQLKAL